MTLFAPFWKLDPWYLAALPRRSGEARLAEFDDEVSAGIGLPSREVLARELDLIPGVHRDLRRHGDREGLLRDRAIPWREVDHGELLDDRRKAVALAVVLPEDPLAERSALVSDQRPVVDDLEVAD